MRNIISTNEYLSSLKSKARSQIVTPAQIVCQGIRDRMNYYRFRRNYRHSVIFIACGTKTAAHWLTLIITNLLPGFRFYYPPSLADGRTGESLDVTPKVLKELSGKLCVVRAHIPATPTNTTVLDKQLERYLTTIRDPRDVLISVYYQVRLRRNTMFLQLDPVNRRLPWTPLSPDVLKLNKKELYDILISNLLPDLVAFARRWFDYQKNHDNVLLVRTEDLKKNPVFEIKKILSFFGISRTEAEIISAVESLPKKDWNLRKGSSTPPVPGKWREELTKDQQLRCEEIARPFLIEANYPLYFG